jgi:hypothetical protein
MRCFWIAKDTLEATLELLKELRKLKEPEGYGSSGGGSSGSEQ